MGDEPDDPCGVLLGGYVECFGEVVSDVGKAGDEPGSLHRAAYHSGARSCFMGAIV
jgi:hypothetical protein